MPIYEYQCQSCGHEMEALQKISDPLLTECPECHQSALKKKVSAAGFRLKGGGWYETDFKSANRKNVAGDTGSSNTASSSGESKPAAKTESSAASSPPKSSSSD